MKRSGFKPRTKPLARTSQLGRGAFGAKPMPLLRVTPLKRTRMKRRLPTALPDEVAERRKFVNGLDCCACGKDAPSHAHHPILLGRGKSQKAPEHMLIPLCESSTGRLGCHDALHLRQGRFAGMTKEQLRAWQLARVEEIQDRYEYATNPMRRAV